MQKPRLLVIEGVDGVGKTTLAKSLALRFGFHYIYLPQPPLADIRKDVEEMRDLPTRFFYYLTAGIAVQPLIRSLLKEGKEIILDRYVYSTIAMHRALGFDTSSVAVRALPILWPDLSILLLANREIREERRILRGDDLGSSDQYIEQRQDVLDLAQELYLAFEEFHAIDTNTLDAVQVLTKAAYLIEKGV